MYSWYKNRNFLERIKKLYILMYNLITKNNVRILPSVSVIDRTFLKNIRNE